MYRSNYGLYPNVTIDKALYAPCQTTELSAEKLKEYKLKITTWKYQDPTQHYWEYLFVQVFDKNEKCCAEFARNYYGFDGIVVTQNGTDYLITSSNYQCITIVNLTTGAVKSYTDVDDIKHGCGFCPIAFEWDDGTLLVDGCVWACPYETMKCENIDLENPIPAFNTAEWIDDDMETYTEEDDDDE